MNKKNCIVFILMCSLFACQKKNDGLGEYPYETDKEPLGIKFSTETLRPDISAPGSTISLSGEGFLKYKKEDLIVRFNGEQGEVLTIADNKLDVKIPAKASSGLVTLTVKNQVLPGPLHKISGAVSIDAVFKSFPGASGGIVRSIRFQNDGKFIIAGSFTDYDNSGEVDGMKGVARLNADGSIDRTFKSKKSINGFASDAIQLADGRYLLAGQFSNYNNRFKPGYVQNAITLNNDGSPDTVKINFALPITKKDTVPALNIGFDNTVTKLHLQTDGKIIVIGNFRKVFVKNYAGVSANGLRDSVQIDTLKINYIARLNSDLTVDTTFNFNRTAPNGQETVNGPINDSYLNSDDQLVIAGGFTTYNSMPAVRVARLDTLGILDNTFSTGAGPDNDVTSMSPLTDGRILIAGKFINVAGKSLRKVALLSAAGAVDNGFDTGSGADGNISFVRVLDNGKILVSGFFENFQGYKRDGIAIIETDGKLSTTHNNFGGFKNGFVTAAAAIQGRNSIVLTGLFTLLDLKQVSGIVKMNY